MGNTQKLCELAIVASTLTFCNVRGNRDGATSQLLDQAKPFGLRPPICFAIHSNDEIHCALPRNEIPIAFDSGPAADAIHARYIVSVHQSACCLPRAACLFRDKRPQVFKGALRGGFHLGQRRPRLAGELDFHRNRAIESNLVERGENLGEIDFA